MGLSFIQNWQKRWVCNSELTWYDSFGWRSSDTAFWKRRRAQNHFWVFLFSMSYFRPTCFGPTSFGGLSLLRRLPVRPWVLGIGVQGVLVGPRAQLEALLTHTPHTFRSFGNSWQQRFFEGCGKDVLILKSASTRIFTFAALFWLYI